MTFTIWIVCINIVVNVSGISIIFQSLLCDAHGDYLNPLVYFRMRRRSFRKFFTKKFFFVLFDNFWLLIFLKNWWKTISTMLTVWNQSLYFLDSLLILYRFSYFFAKITSTIINTNCWKNKIILINGKTTVFKPYF